MVDLNQILTQYGNVTIFETAEKKHLYFIAVALKMVDFTTAVDMLAKDDHIEEIMYNGKNQPIRVFHQTYGMCDTNLSGKNLLYSDAGVNEFISQIAVSNSKSINQDNPIFDGVLEDGSRINITIPPTSLEVSITIRKFKRTMLSPLDFMKENIFTPESVAFLWTCIDRTGSPANILFVGGTASGKTTALNAFSMFIERNERIVVIEDTPELQLHQPNIVRMVASNSIDMYSLLRNALRMRPDRIIVGEVRGKEAISLFGAMNTGQAGCFGTLHASSAKECISRITNAPLNVPQGLLKALNLIVVMKVLPSGIRYVQEIAEVAGVDAKNVRLNTLFAWNAKQKKCLPTGIPSYLKSKIAQDAGIEIGDVDTIISKRIQKFQELLQSNAGAPEFEAALKS